MESLRYSKYNYEICDEEGKAFICNGLSGTIVKKNENFFDIGKLKNEEISFLKEHNFIYEESVDESALLRERNNSFSHNHRRLELTLMLHENCNFRCTYCFEDFKNKKFEGDTINKLITFVEQKLPTNGELFIHFYGGEPLLAWDSLIKIYDKLSEVAKLKNSFATFFITTNGSLLTHDKVNAIAQRAISHVKITLDGPPEVHNRRRKKVKGGETFDAILKNLLYSAEFFKVIIRVNIDRENVQYIPKLIEIILKCSKKKSIKNIFFDYNIVWTPCSSFLDSSVDYNDIYQIQSLTLDKGFKLNMPPLVRNRHCKFNSSNSYLFDTSGKAYLCSVSEKTNVGSLMEIKVNKESAEVSAFYSNRSECNSCNLLPICGGGCSILSINASKPPCPPWKGMYIKYLEIQLRNNMASNLINN
jgi:uncharacterized protein